jgi:hypothetical protein
MTDTSTRTDTPSTTEAAKEKAAEVAASAKQTAGQVTDEAREQAAEVVSSATDQLGQVVGTARDELRNRASAEATNLGQRLGDIAEELRAMAQASVEHGGVAATAVCGVADQVDRGARRLSEGDLDTALDDLKRFARNRPGTFLLGAMGAGFAVGRLLRHADLKEIGQAAKPASDNGSSDLTGLANGHSAAELASPSSLEPAAVSQPLQTQQPTQPGQPVQQPQQPVQPTQPSTGGTF